jgi:hypothetical protein
MKILVIDVGLLHFALIGADLEKDYLNREKVILEKEIFFCDVIDITELITDCNDKECILYHDKIICDYMMHLFKKFRSLFDMVDKILIERQPPMGLVAVQELIMREYRNKSELISPNSMHCFFKIQQYDYDERKIHTVKIAMEYLGSLKTFIFNERKHDMADALCILYYFINLKQKEQQMLDKEMKYKEMKYSDINFISNLDQFKYK